MELIKEINDMAAPMMPETQDEMKRLAEYWMENGADMSEDELRDAIGNDLEQLEYTPDQVDQMIPVILQMVRGGTE